MGKSTLQKPKPETEKLLTELEKEYLDKYLNLGFIKINRIKTGNLGGGKIVWTKERCLEIAKKYSKRFKDFDIGFLYSAGIPPEIANKCYKKLNDNSFMDG